MTKSVPISSTTSPELSLRGHEHAIRHLVERIELDLQNEIQQNIELV